jgi:tRNA (adenine22-N1)-methyltransferase
MISKRLESLSKYFNSNDKVIDIGCDHALLDIYLIQNNILSSMIVSDIHEGAIKQGIDNIKLNKLDKKIDARLGDGLKVLNDKDDVDTILISGMGTSTILSIIENPYFKKINKLVIQSNNDHEILRTELVKKSFNITHEEMIKENGKTYINIVFERGRKTYAPLELKYGPLLVRNMEYLKYREDYLKNILNKVPRNKLLIRFKLRKEINEIKKLEKNII